MRAKTPCPNPLYFKNALKTKGETRSKKKQREDKKKGKEKRHRLKKSKKKDSSNLAIRAPGDGQRASPAFGRGTGEGILGALADGGAQFLLALL